MKTEVYECDDCKNTALIEKINKSEGAKDALPPGWIELKMFTNTKKVKQIPVEHEVLHFDGEDCMKSYFYFTDASKSYEERNPGESMASATI